MGRFSSVLLVLLLLAIGPSCGLGDDRTVAVTAFRGTVSQLMGVLQKSGVPVSVIQAPNDPELAVDEHRIGVPRLLERVETATGTYRAEWIEGHAVLYPKNLPFDRVVGNVEIAGRRSDAAAAYLKFLRATVPEIPPIFGPGALRVGADGPIPLYDDTVTLKPRGRVIDHLVQLLGADKNVYFVIKKDPGLKSPAEGMVMFLGRIEGSS